jgi:phosphoserine phosphatase
MRPLLNKPGLLFMDMDSTLIQCECIDEIADFMGIKHEISEITERAMRGELDFAASLTERVQLLAGLDASVLETVYKERIELTEGAEVLIKTLHTNEWKVGLVSGGFTYFTDRFKEDLGLDFTLSNRLEIHNGRLTGSVLGDIVDAERKRHALLEQADIFSIPMSQTVAIGDGANDLPMIGAAGMGIAFHAKPRVQEAAPYTINSGGLDRVLDLFGHNEGDTI